MSAPTRDEWIVGVQLAPGLSIHAGDGDPFLKLPAGDVVYLRDYAQQIVTFLNRRTDFATTHDDVEMLRTEAYEELIEIIPEAAKLLDLADRIAMVLPPKETE